MARTTDPTFAHRLQLILVQAVESLVRLLPWRSAGALGRAAGRLAYHLDARHRRVVRENLRGAGLGLDDRGMRRLSRECFEHFGAVMFSTLRLLRATPEEVRAVYRIEGREHLRAAYGEGKGIIGLTGHLGNWEILALAVVLEEFPMAVVGRALDNPLLEARLRDFRTRFGNTVIPKDGAVRGALKALKERRVVGFLLDQDALTAGVFVRFFGRWASTFPAAAMLAVKFDLPILPVSSRVDADGTVTIVADPPFHAPSTGDPARDIWYTTQRMTSWLEAQVRANPSQWFWMHRRFKTQPGPGQPELPPAEWVAAEPDQAGAR
jgi:KDO2-lipid IV(A) lauroyltransferase